MWPLGDLINFMVAYIMDPAIHDAANVMLVAAGVMILAVISLPIP